MYRNFVPKPFHAQADQLINDLKSLMDKPTICPYCQHNQFYAINTKTGYYRCKSCKKGFNRSVNTPFYHLTHLDWLPSIAIRRLCGQHSALIRQELNCSLWMVKRRIVLIEQYMQQHYPELYQWYQHFIHNTDNELPIAVQQQTEQLKNWVNQQLQLNEATCPHCESPNTKKTNAARGQFRCKNCWRYFSTFKGTGLEHLSNSENWLTMIDMLVAGDTYQAIQQKLGISFGTITYHRRVWLKIMRHLGLFLLHEWIMGQKGR